MSRIRITAYYDPDPDEIDEEHETGLTKEAFATIFDALAHVGLSNIDLSPG